MIGATTQQIGMLLTNCRVPSLEQVDDLYTANVTGRVMIVIMASNVSFVVWPLSTCHVQKKYQKHEMPIEINPWKSKVYVFEHSK
jgi:hypothetical protein